ncbi:hypothetical protein D623_10031924 [Myotis brandtii]|uniref:Uncharacterized protein n=1 Tax=Myotis brandtii TaxID=109478 RepID=S7MVM7_MYOBR|nr:hypothetical protein D623_10031924 [Myotis brandtii]
MARKVSSVLALFREAGWPGSCAALHSQSPGTELLEGNVPLHSKGAFSLLHPQPRRRETGSSGFDKRKKESGDPEPPPDFRPLILASRSSALSGS